VLGLAALDKSRNFEADGSDEGVEIVDDALIEAIETFFDSSLASALIGLRRPAVSGA
jgi:hypothetical protein